MRFAYAVLTYLLCPVYAFYWLFRGMSERSYLDRLGQLTQATTDRCAGVVLKCNVLGRHAFWVPF